MFVYRNMDINKDKLERIQQCYPKSFQYELADRDITTKYNIILQDDISESPEYHLLHSPQGAWRDLDHDLEKARNVHSS